METTHDAGHKSSPTDSDDTHSTTEDTGGFDFNHTETPDITSLTDFQKRILAVLAQEARYGLAIKRELEDYYGEEVNHGRLYPNLDELVNKDLVEKSELDKRTNQYALTDAGRRALREDVLWLTERVDHTAPKGGDA